MWFAHEKLPYRAVTDLPGNRSIVDPRRLKLARKALERRQEAAGLFAEPTPDGAEVERLARFAAKDEADLQHRRQARARALRACRRGLRALPEEIRLELLWRWNRASYNRDPVYLLEVINKTCHPAACAAIAEGRDDPYLERFVSPYVLALLPRELLDSLPAKREAFAAKLASAGRQVSCRGAA